MEIIAPEDGKEAYNKDGVLGRKLLSKEEVDVVHIRVEAGSTLPLHTTPVDVFFYIIDGEGEIEIGEERRAVSSGVVVESPKDIPHALHNPGSSPFEVLVVKTPRP